MYYILLWYFKKGENRKWIHMLITVYNLFIFIWVLKSMVKCDQSTNMNVWNNEIKKCGNILKLNNFFFFYGISIKYWQW